MNKKTGEIFGAETTGVNQILPHKNLWAWNLYKQGKNNNWTPEEVPMTRDINMLQTLSVDSIWPGRCMKNVYITIQLYIFVIV